MWHEIAGIFVVEVKAVTLDEIEYFGWQRCKIRGRDEDSGPQQQAHKAREKPHELTIDADRQLTRTRDRLFPTAADAFVCPAIASQPSGSFKTGQTGSLLNRR
jgi:hypothetical protein